MTTANDASDSSTPMTFEQFAAARKSVPDLSTCGEPSITDQMEHHGSTPGNIYPLGLHIIDQGEGAKDGRWYLIIANCEWMDDDLAKLERILFDAFESEITAPATSL